MSMSLDGFIAGPNHEDGGLHDYYFSPGRASARVIEEGIRATGAIIMGRRTYDAGAEQGGYADFPYQSTNFVVTHNPPQIVPKGAEAFVFVTDGIKSALAKAQVAAGEKDVVLGGGASLAQQYLKAGLVDELQIHLVAKLFGSGFCLFGQIGIALEQISVIEGAGVTHLRYRVVK
jgi:dihydrofolate reductase